MLRWGRVEVTGGFLLLAAALYYLDGQNILPWAACACFCHELGHLLAIHAMGGRVARIRLSLTGAEMALSAARPLGLGGNLVSSLAGPIANLALALLAAGAGERWYLFAGLNLSLAAFNLLPVAQLDGGRAVYSLVAILWSRQTAEQVVDILSKAMVWGLMLAGGALFWVTRTNFTLLVTASWLTLSLSVPKGRK